MFENNSQISVIRELAKQYMEIALSEKHQKMRRRFRDSNDLKIVRPPLIIEEIQWEQMNLDGALDLKCEEPFYKNIEAFFRRELFREKYLKCDNYIEPYWVVQKSFSSTDNGLNCVEKTINAESTAIQSHEYEDILEDESSLEAFHLPEITAYPEKDAQNVEKMQEILGDTMPVVLRGHGIYYAPWDRIIRLRGVEPVLYDFYERPEYLHKIISLYTKAMECEMAQMEALGLYDPRLISVHCTPADFTPKNGGNKNGADSESFGCKDIWFRTMAQTFSSVSPEMHDEFEIQYAIPLAEKCAYTYYGCCEPLHDRIDKVKQIKNLRKIGVSPWADVEASAEQIGGEYVMSRKPNPANVAIKTDPDVIRSEIEETAKICLKYGCPCDITLKDISTVSNRPENLIVWAEAASEVLDCYYGKD